MKFLRSSLLAATCFFVLTGSAFAAHLSDQDLTLSVTLLPGSISAPSSTGTLTYEAQEGVHDALTSTTGLEVDHYYVWVTVNGQPVAAVDPVAFYSLR